MPSLADYVSLYALATDIRPGSVEQLLYAVRSLDRWAGHSVMLDELCDDLLNRWIAAMLEKGLARPTVRNRRGAVVTLWRAAADSGLVGTWPRRVRTVKVPRTLPEAWELAQVQMLLEAASDVEGVFRGKGIERSKLLRAWIMADWDSGFRPCDLLALSRSDVAENGAIAVVQAKTNWPVLCRLKPETLAAIDATYPPQRKRIFPLDRRSIHRWMKLLAASAGLRGSAKWLRRSGATAVEDEHPGAAQHYLGHRTPGLAWRHYIDPRHLRKQQHRPPPPLMG